MNNNTELISVILPTYNAGKYLPQCLDNLLSQTHVKIEVIAIDDFSRDNSYKILTNYRKKDPRIHAFRNVKRYGMALTLNRALKRAKGKFIAFMRAEDVAHPQRLTQQLLYLLANERTVAVGTQCLFMDEQNKKEGRSNFPVDYIDIYKKPLHETTFLFESLLVNKYRIPKDVLHFNSNKHPFLYADIFMKLMKYGEVSNLSQYLYYRRNIVTKKQKTTTQELPTLIKVWARSIALHDVNPSLKSIFFPSIKTKISS